MKVLIDQWGARNVGIALMVLAALFLVAALMVGWEAIQRGLGILALERAQSSALGLERRAAITHGREAAEWMPRETAAGLSAIDLSDPKAGAELARLELRVPMKYRQTVAAIQALHKLHHQGVPATSLAAGDLALVTHLLKLAKGDPPGPVTLPDSDLPQAPLLTYAAQVRFRAAWALGTPELIRATAGELRLLMPTHPDTRGVELVLSALTPAVPDDTVRQLAGSLTRSDKRDLILLKLAAIVPSRVAAFKGLLPISAGAAP